MVLQVRPQCWSAPDSVPAADSQSLLLWDYWVKGPSLPHHWNLQHSWASTLWYHMILPLFCHSPVPQLLSCCCCWQASDKHGVPLMPCFGCALPE